MNRMKSSSRLTVRRGCGHGRLHRSAVVLLAIVGILLLVSGCAARAPSAENSAAMYEAAAPAADEYARPMDTSAVAQEGGVLPQGSTSSALLARKMIARASVSLVVADTHQAITDIDALMSEVGGFVSNSNLYDLGGRERPVLAGNLTLRVPAEQLDETLDRLEALAVQVGSRTLSREDVTDRYSDIDAQLRNLEATEAELREMLTEVRERPDSTPDDILTVHARMTEVRGQIEVLQGQQNMLDNLIALSTIDVNLAPDAASLPVVEEGWRPGTVLRDATRALVNSLQWIGSAAIWFVVAVVPVLLMLLLPIVLLVAIVRWIVLRRRARQTRQADAPA
jgi:hypothetical protein